MYVPCVHHKYSVYHRYPDKDDISQILFREHGSVTSGVFSAESYALFAIATICLLLLQFNNFLKIIINWIMRKTNQIQIVTIFIEDLPSLTRFGFCIIKLLRLTCNTLFCSCVEQRSWIWARNTSDIIIERFIFRAVFNLFLIWNLA